MQSSRWSNRATAWLFIATITPESTAGSSLNQLPQRAAAQWLPESECVAIIQMGSLKLFHWKHKTLTPAKKKKELSCCKAHEGRLKLLVGCFWHQAGAVWSALSPYMMKCLESSFSVIFWLLNNFRSSLSQSSNKLFHKKQNCQILVT